MTQAQRQDDDANCGLVAADARAILRRARKGALATLLPDGAPYTSLVTLAADPDGSPLILISRLARHTQNLERDARASILLDETGVAGDPLAGARLSVSGRFSKTDGSATGKQRFLARQPDAAGYAEFSDFAFWRMEVEGGHFIGGFGRIHDLTLAELLIDISGADSLIGAETGIVEHMNQDHADAVERYAVALFGAPAGPWRMTGCDPEGCDLVLGELALRLTFPERVATPGDARRALIELVDQARAHERSEASSPRS